MSDLLDALLGRGIQFRRSASDPAEVSLCCPFCTDRKFRLGVNIQKDIAHCFNCEWKTRKAIEELGIALDLGILSAVDEEQQEEVKPPPPALPDDFVLLADPPKGILYRRAKDYLLQRGVTARQIEEKKIGVSFCGEYAYRIVFPVYYGRVLQGIVTRDFTGKQEPKYRNSRGMKAVYNSPVKKKNKAVLTEGVFDCLALERVLPTDNYDILSLLGHGLTDQQEERLEDYRDIVLWPDVDVPGVKGFLEIGKRLEMHHRMFTILLRDLGKDAGEMGKSDLLYAWASKTRLTDALALKMKVEVEFRE